LGSSPTKPILKEKGTMSRPGKLDIDWEGHKMKILNLYLTKDWGLDDVKSHMEENHSFSAT
jgi:Clr5 domain